MTNLPLATSSDNIDLGDPDSIGNLWCRTTHIHRRVETTNGHPGTLRKDTSLSRPYISPSDNPLMKTSSGNSSLSLWPHSLHAPPSLL